MNKNRYIGIFALVFVVVTSIPSASIIASQEGPNYGGTLIMARLGDSSTLNPLLTIDDYSFMVGNQIFSGLIARGIDEQGNLAYWPDLAETWDIAEDGLSITFNLRENVKWHDGVPFTAEDVKYTFETLYQDKELALPQQGFFDPIDYVEIVDDHTTIFHLEHISPIFMPLGLAFWRDKEVVPKHIFENIDDFWNNDFNEAPTVGTGPFKFVSWDKGDQIVLEKNENYYMKDADGNQLPYLNKIIFKVAPNSASQIAALETGEASCVNFLPEPEVTRLMENEEINVFPIFTKLGLTSYLMINQGTSELGNENPILQDRNVRYAIIHALDRQAIIDIALGGFGKLQTSWVSSALGLFYEPNVPKYPYDPELAKQLLTDYPVQDDGFRFTLRLYHTAGDTVRERASEIVKSQLSEVGINIDIISADAPTLYTWIKDQYDFDLYWGGHATGPDPDRLFVYYHGSQIAPGNWQCIRYNNSAFDALWDKSRVEPNPETRANYFKEMQMILMEDLPIIPIQERVLFAAAGADWQELDKTGAYWYCNHFDKVWWTKGTPPEPAVLEFPMTTGVAFIVLVITGGFVSSLVKKKQK